MTRGPARLPALECRTLLFDLRDLSSWVSQSLSAFDCQRLMANNGVGSGRMTPMTVSPPARRSGSGSAPFVDALPIRFDEL